MTNDELEEKYKYIGKKITQIIPLQVNGARGSKYDTIAALTEDGSVYKYENGWAKYPQIQPDPLEEN